MALIEQFCQRQIRSLQSRVPDFKDWQHRVRAEILHYVSGSEPEPQPTASALILLLKAVAHRSAAVYRQHAPMLREKAARLPSVAANPLPMARDLIAKLRREAHLQQEIFARVTRLSA